MKRTIQTIVFVLIATLVLTYPVMAQESNPTDTVSITIFAVLTAVFTSLMQSVGVGAALSFLNQLGKIWAPKYFPDGSSGNWRLAAILVLTVVIVFGPALFPETAKYLTIFNLDQLGKDFAQFGSLLIPLFISASKYSSELFYKWTLRGAFLGKSYSLQIK
ncbi:MAG TPA: hypothetical protein PLL95_03905 [Anaerolineales bacterium]|nr:hypothetical protein [Anaerolineales bacterium]